MYPTRKAIRITQPGRCPDTLCPGLPLIRKISVLCPSRKMFKAQLICVFADRTVGGRSVS